MCEGCNNTELEVQGAENQETLVDLSSEERYVELEVEKEILRIEKEIIYDDESLAELINSENFQKGCNDASYYCGFYTSLINSGISNKFAEECVMNKMTCDHNYTLQESSNKASIEISKNQANMLDKQQV